MSLTLNVNRLVALGQQIDGRHTASRWADEVGSTLENIAFLEKQYATFDSAVKVLQAKPVLTPSEELELQQLQNCRSGVWTLKEAMLRERQICKDRFQVKEEAVDSLMKSDMAKREQEKDDKALQEMGVLLLFSLSIISMFIYIVKVSQVGVDFTLREDFGWNYTTFYSFFYHLTLGIYMGVAAVVIMAAQLKFAYLFIFFVLTKMLTYLRKKYGWWSGGSLNFWYASLHITLGFTMVTATLNVGLLKGEWIWSNFVAALLAPYGFYFLVVFVVWNVVKSSVRSILQNLGGDLK